MLSTVSTIANPGSSALPSTNPEGRQLHLSPVRNHRLHLSLSFLPLRTHSPVRLQHYPQVVPIQSLRLQVVLHHRWTNQNLHEMTWFLRSTQRRLLSQLLPRTRDLTSLSSHRTRQAQNNTQIPKMTSRNSDEKRKHNPLDPYRLLLPLLDCRLSLTLNYPHYLRQPLISPSSTLRPSPRPTWNPIQANL